MTLKQLETIMKVGGTALTVLGTAATTAEVMMKAFKWYEKRHGNKDKKEDYTRPIIKGL